MDLILNLDAPRPDRPLRYTDKVLLIGSCFTEHISERLSLHKFDTLANPHGILFNPLSVAFSLDSYLDGRQYVADDLFHLNELWNSWDHHTRFSDVSREETLARINASQTGASSYIQKADWIFITLGSAFQYFLKDTGRPVANNHRAPAQWFEKRLLGIDEIIAVLTNTLNKALNLNPAARFVFTISPVRHIRDGVIDNNRSKARLIDAVHEICSRFPQAFYFPAYEFVIDILRDYRFYDIDFVHPNYLATQFVWEKFAATYMEDSTRAIMTKVQEIRTACGHRPRFPDTEAHRNFMKSYYRKTKELQDQYPFLDLSQELDHFSA